MTAEVEMMTEAERTAAHDRQRRKADGSRRSLARWKKLADRALADCFSLTAHPQDFLEFERLAERQRLAASAHQADINLLNGSLNG